MALCVPKGQKDSSFGWMALVHPSLGPSLHECTSSTRARPTQPVARRVSVSCAGSPSTQHSSARCTRSVSLREAVRGRAGCHCSRVQPVLTLHITIPLPRPHATEGHPGAPSEHRPSHRARTAWAAVSTRMATLRHFLRHSASFHARSLDSYSSSPRLGPQDSRPRPRCSGLLCGWPLAQAPV